MHRRLALGLLLAMLLGLMPTGVLAADKTSDTYSYSWSGMDIEDIPTAEGEEDSEYFKEMRKNGALAQSLEDEDGMSASVKAGSGPTSYADCTLRAVNGETVRYGVDVSEHRGNINWKSVAASGVEFAIIRVGGRYYGSGGMYRDDKYVQNLKGAKANGIKVGAYVFSQAITVDEAIEEARFIMELVKGYDMDLPLVIDYEYVATGVGRLYHANLSRQAATDICNAFCAEVEKNGYQSMVYANMNMLSSKMYANQLGRVWMANYTTRTSYSGKYEYWQFSSNGSIPGIPGNCDMNFWFDPSGQPGNTLPFRDVVVGRWDYEYIKWAYENEVVNGITLTQFGHDSNATRGQLITMLYRMMGTEPENRTSAFTDLKESWYWDAVLWAEQNNITTGQTATTFGPYDNIRRQDLATMLWRMHEEPKSTQSLSKFGDAAKVDSYAKEAMAWAVEKGIVNGYEEDNTLRPSAYATRAQVCAMLMRYDALLEKEKEEQEKPVEPEEPEEPEESDSSSDSTPSEPTESGTEVSPSPTPAG